MTLRINSMQLYDPIHSDVILKISFRKIHIQTTPTLTFDSLSGIEHSFPLTYHSLLFDSLKINLFEHRPFTGWKKFGSVRIRIAKLPSINGHLIHHVDIKKQLLTSNPHLDESSIGSMQLEFNFIGGEMQIDNTLPMTPISDISEDSFISNTSKISSHIQKDAVGELIHYIEKVGLETDEIEIADDLLDNLSIATKSSRFKRFFKRSASTNSMGSIPSLDSKLTARPGKVISLRTNLGLKEFAEFAASFFKTGWNLSKLELVKSLSFVQKYYTQYHAQERTNDIIKDANKIKIALYWLNFTVAAYGSFIINWCGAGSGYILDKLKTQANQKAAAKYLGIEMCDMLVWEFDGNEMFKPSFFICRDVQTNSIVLSIRGTWSIQDTLTDLCAEYEPYKGGFVHTGFQRGAQWIIDHYQTQLVTFIEEYNCSALYIVGHSLGGAIASLFTLHFCATADAIRVNRPDFVHHCYNYAAPATCSMNLAEEGEGLIDSFVNENDIVPRCSYGSASDFKELVKAASVIMKTQSPEQMEALDMIRRKQLIASDHPKIYIPGDVYYMYKVSRATPKHVIESRQNTPVEGGAFGFKGSASSFIDVSMGHYIVEKSSRMLFLTMHLKSNLLFHHFPDKHDNALRKAVEHIELMEKNGVV